ncbi:MAG: MATE family efflux transporter [Lachnospiraceae bacterium]|nr:MATE family efflux transporter [Lachnospiraceae bacterium]
MSARENKMGVMPVKKLIVNMALPMMISMLVQALYNIVDSAFVSKLSEEALTAVTLAFPMQNLMIAFGSGTGVGINALLSKALGEKEFDRSDAAANTGLLLTFFNYLLFLLLGLFAAGPFIRSQTGVEQIQTYGVQYLEIVCCISVGLFFQMTFERLLQSTGRTMLSMASQLTGAVINIILDPIMIFGLLGCPAFGVAGAAYATVIGQLIGAAIGLTLNLKKNTELHFSMRSILHPSSRVIKQIYFVGVPSIMMMSIGSVMTYLFNLILGAFSATAQAVFGVYFKLQSFFFMPIFGLNNGLIPVLAYNYGARNKKRIEDALRFALTLAVSIMIVGTVIFESVPDVLLGIFDASEQLREMGRPALRIIAIHFPLAGASIALGSVFQAFSKSTYSLIISVARQLVVLIPVAWLLSLTGVVTNVWWAFPIAEVVSLLISIFLFRKLYNAVVKPL